MSILTAALVVALAPATALAQDHVIDSADGTDLLVVVSGREAVVVDDYLTLVSVPSVVWFSDRPERTAGHWDIDRLVEMWDEGTDTFAADPPNADLSFLSDDAPGDTVVELLSVSVDGDDVSFDICVIEGDVPNGSYGPASLFIDPIWNPPGDTSS